MPDTIPLPNLDWYKALSEVKGLPKHCPFADNEKCLRYWRTKELLAISLSNDRETQRINDFWGNPPEYIRNIPLPAIEYMGEARPRESKNMCPEAASSHFWGLFLSGFLNRKPAYGERSVYDHFIMENLHWPETSEDDLKFIEYIDWLKNVADTNFHSMHYSDCPVYKTMEGVTETASRREYNCSETERGIFVIRKDVEEKLRIEESNKTVNIENRNIPLTPNQLKVVKEFYNNYKRGQYECSENRMCSNAGVSSRRLRDVFKSRPESLESLFEKTTRQTFYKFKI